MKLFKKLLSYIIALTMVLSLATLLGGNVHAAQPYTLTIEKTKANHKYAVYKVFGGDLKVDGDTKTLSNVVWGNGVDGSALLGELQRDPQFNKLNDKKETYNVFASAEEAKDVARILSDNYTGFDSTGAKAFAQDVGKHLSTAVTFGEGKDYVESSDPSTTITLPEPGYYFVKDKDAVSGEDASTRFIVQVVGNASVDVKSSVPTVTKKVDDVNDSTGAEEKLKDSADYDIGDQVPYTITGTLPSTYNDYTSYKYEFTDTMCQGLSYTEKTAKVWMYTSDRDTEPTDVTNAFNETITNAPNATDDSKDKVYNGGKVIKWSCDDLKNHDETKNAAYGYKFVVKYNATLNTSAKIGAAGNPNKVDLTYSNNPNNGGSGETGKTPEDKNIVFTYEAIFNKVDDKKQPLAGAKFELFKNEKGKGTADKWVSKGNLDSTLVDGKYTYTFSGLDDGQYKLKETQTPSGYNTMADKEFTISAEHTQDPNTLELRSLNVTGLEATVNENAGTIKADIENKPGSTLPSTGGMGTTLLYVAGGILVACAAAYVVLNKKRA